MRFPAAAVIIASLLGVGAGAQNGTETLGEFAREERLRRESLGLRAQRVFTSADMLPAPLPVAAGPAGEVGADAAPPDLGASAGGETAAGGTAELLAAVTRQVELVEDLADQEVRLRLEINRLRGEYLAPVGSQGDRSAALAAMNESQARLVDLSARLAEARETLARLEQAIDDLPADPQ